MARNSTPYTQRVKVGAYYTDGRDLWQVTDVNDLGTVTLETDRRETDRTLGIDVFRRTFWIVLDAEGAG